LRITGLPAPRFRPLVPVGVASAGEKMADGVPALADSTGLWILAPTSAPTDRTTQGLRKLDIANF